MSLQFRKLVGPANYTGKLLVHRWYAGLLFAGIAGVPLLMVLERHIVWNVWPVRDHLAIDFFFVPLTAVVVLQALTLVMPGRLSKSTWWPRGAVVAATVFQWGIELRQLDGYILPLYSRPTGVWVVLDFFSRYLGSSYDWDQMVTIGLGGMATMVAIVCEQRVSAKAGLPPGWCFASTSSEGALHEASQRQNQVVGGNSSARRGHPRLNGRWRRPARGMFLRQCQLALRVLLPGVAIGQ